MVKSSTLPIRVALVSLAVCFLSFDALAQTKMMGVLQDVQGSRIGSGSVEISRGAIVKRVVTAADGSFDVDLDSGLYQIAAFAPGFCPAKRAPLRVPKSGELPKITIDLVACSLVHSITLEKDGKGGEEDTYKMPFKEELIHLKRSGFDEAVHFRFGGKSKSANVIIYSSVELENGQTLPVALTCGLSTIKATKILLNRKTMVFELLGEVTSENATITKRANGRTVVPARSICNQ